MYKRQLHAGELAVGLDQPGDRRAAEVDDETGAAGRREPCAPPVGGLVEPDRELARVERELAALQPGDRAAPA